MRTRYLGFVFLLAFFTSCSHPKFPEQQLIDADNAFNKMCAEKGLKAAFLSYAADSSINLGEGTFPIIGKENLRRHLEQRKDHPLKWKPLKAEISKSGELGYTFGNWELTVNDTTFYGNYVTIWKKQTDGSWKYILDTGNSTPKP